MHTNRIPAYRIPVLMLVLVLTVAGCQSEPASQTVSGETTTSPEPQRPNIVFILTDDMPKRDLRYMPRTRKLLGKGGVTFRNAFTTYTICCPARSTILRGQYAHNHKIVGNWEPFGGEKKFRRLGLDRSTIATWLKSSGYETFLAGKYLNDYEGTYVPPGWDEWYAKSGGLKENEYNENGRLVREGDRTDADLIGYWAMRYIQKPHDRPFFMYLSTHAPHRPHQVAPRHEKAYPNARAPRTPSFDERDMSDKPAWVRRKAGERLTSRQIRKLDREHRDKARALLAVDEMVADVYAALESAGELRNTYLIFTSDSGFKEGQHRLNGKWSPYEEDIRVPLLVRGPGVPAGKELDHLVINTDYAPTLAELAGAKPGHEVDGRSMAPLLGEDPPLPESWRSRFLVENYRSKFPGGATSTVPGYRALRTRNVLYVEYFTDPAQRELYNLKKDPYQLKSLHRTADRRLLEELSGQLSRLAKCEGKECRAAEGG